MESYFVINEFEDGYNMEEAHIYDVAFIYCTEVLFIPDKNISELNMKSFGLEILLKDLDLSDVREDWYSNLHKISIDNKYI